MAGGLLGPWSVDFLSVGCGDNIAGVRLECDREDGWVFGSLPCFSKTVLNACDSYWPDLPPPRGGGPLGPSDAFY